MKMTMPARAMEAGSVKLLARRGWSGLPLSVAKPLGSNVLSSGRCIQSRYAQIIDPITAKLLARTPLSRFGKHAKSTDGHMHHYSYPMLSSEAIRTTVSESSSTPLAWLCSLAHHASHGTPQYRPDGLPNTPNDYELSLGKITDTLQSDYPAFFEREPDFEIYHNQIALELGKPFEGMSGLRGKRSYSRILAALQRVACGTVRDPIVTCHFSDGTPYGHALRVSWQVQGSMVGFQCPIYISAISFYSLAPQMPEFGASPVLSHRIHRHTIEFVEIQPPTLRNLLRSSWGATTWHPAA